jgi:hypothetical protein
MPSHPNEMRAANAGPRLPKPHMQALCAGLGRDPAHTAMLRIFGLHHAVPIAVGERVMIGMV